MSLFEELKRRNVFRVGVAYAVGAWVLLQIFDVVGEILELPEWGGKMILALLVVGFFLALFFAWAFELTPEGVKRESEVDRSQSITPQTGKKLNTAILALMAVAIAYLLFDKFYLSRQLAETPRTAAAQPVAPPPPSDASAEQAAVLVIDPRSIAVLPFDNRSRLEEDAFFVEGIHDDLLTNLARIGSLKVISRTSVGKYKDTGKSIPEIAGELGVATVMEGAVQRSGSTVRINVQLIDAQTDEHLWAEMFDRDLTADNLFAIQSEISEKIARELRATLSPAEQRRINDRPTENLAAYNAYLRARQLMARRNSTDVDQAAAEFQRAAELDPEFALAWVGISETASLQSIYSDLGLPEAMEREAMAVERALALDDQLGEAHLGRANLHEHHERWDEAEASYLRAIELSPGYASAYQWYGNMLARFPGRLDEAVAMLRKALELDPLSSIIQANLADRHIDLGRYDDAERQLDRLQEMDPGFVPLYTTRSWLASQRGQLADEARFLLQAIEMDPGRISTYGALLWVYLDLAYPEPLEEIRRQMSDINDQHLMVGMVDTVSSVYRRNFEAALESAHWTFERMGRPPFFRRVIGYINLAKGDDAAARAAFEQAEPRYFDPASWHSAIQFAPDDGCLVGSLLLRTGDSELGQGLLQASLDYLVNELPRHIAHADRYIVERCYLAMGQIEPALEAIETRAEHGHYEAWWFMRFLPLYEPLWGTPRFEAAMQRIEARVAEQRADLIASEAAEL